MDQNIIILVLLLIAILVAFYSAYLALDTSKKVRRVQSEMKETLTALNNSMNMPVTNNSNAGGVFGGLFKGLTNLVK